MNGAGGYRRFGLACCMGMNGAAVECRGGVEAFPKFASNQPTFLPASCQLQGAETSFFLREASQEAMRNGSIQTRSEPLYIHLPETGLPGALSVNCSYANLTVEAPVPADLLQGSAPGTPALPSPAHVTPSWKVRAHVVARGALSSEQPQLQVLFYLAGRRWDLATAVEEEVGMGMGMGMGGEEEFRLPCVRLMAQREPGEVPLVAQCRLEGSLGICVAALELPAGWFAQAAAAASPRRRAQDAVAPGVELYYTVLPAEGAERDCPAPRERGKGLGRLYGAPNQDEALQNAVPLGRVALGGGEGREGSGRGRLRLDDNVEVTLPMSPIRQGQTVRYQISMSTTATVDQFTLSPLSTLAALSLQLHGKGLRVDYKRQPKRGIEGGREAGREGVGGDVGGGQIRIFSSCSSLDDKKGGISESVGG
ncbi:hypothetical protein ACEWY4_011677 [Coilia grayii]|uniref:Transmembrane protein TMEM132 N-terminal domain-containing protein n=1 Tax=Coilia grayii TaxID=363190 RepID=A0ABD1JYC5_9TELE